MDKGGRGMPQPPRSLPVNMAEVFTNWVDLSHNMSVTKPVSADNHVTACLPLIQRNGIVWNCAELAKILLTYVLHILMYYMHE